MIKQWFAVSALAAGGALMGLACIGVEEDEVDLADEQAAGSEELGLDAAAGCDLQDPGRDYVGTSAEECAAIRFYCKEDTTYFSDECGCGCATPTESAAPERGTRTSAGGQRARCGDLQCGPGEECIGYYGVAGPEGRMFYTCGIRCGIGQEDSCPAGKSCVNISDGPGPLCL